MQRRSLALAPLGPLAALLSLAMVAGCSSDKGSPDKGPKTDADYQAEVTTGMHDTVALEITAWKQAAKELQSAAPATAGRGWDATADAQAIAAMRDAWRRTRIAYEHFEGVVAPLFPEIDGAVDARYDDFLADLGGKGDPDPFDDQGVTGMHAIERILWANAVPTKVVDFEKTLPGYQAAAFPGTEAEAASFKNKLVARLVADIEKLETQWQPSNIDLGGAFQGLIALMNEQREKVDKASLGEEESRYARVTLFDLRNNLEGTVRVYALFKPWVLTKHDVDPAKEGAARNQAIEAGLAKLTALYATYPGDDLPAPPATWSADRPAPGDLDSPFGKLFTTVRAAVDPTTDGSIVDEMNDVAGLLGFPEFKVAD
jgi:iron uptake system component EfeO